MITLSISQLLSAILFSALLLSTSTISRAQTPARLLEPDVPLSAELKKGEVHSYRITLAPEQFINVEFKSRIGFGVPFKIRAPDGELVAEVNQRSSSFQTQRLFFVSQSAGEYRLEFAQDSINPTPYEIKVVALRPATAEDRRSYVTQQLYAEVIGALNGSERKIREATEKLPGLLSLYKSSGDRRGEAEALYVGGVLHSQTDSATKALEYFTQALPLTRELGDRRAEAYTLSNISDLNIGLGEPQIAIDHAEQALRLWRDLGDTPGEALTLHNSSVIFRRAGDWQKALSSQQRALEIWQGSAGAEAFARLGLGHFYRGMGEQDRALDYYGQALTLWEGLKSENRFLRAVAHNYLGEIYNDRGEQQAALDHLNRGLELVRAVRDTGVVEGSLLVNLGVAYEKSGKLQQALEQYNEALTRIRRTGQLSPTAQVLYRLGELQLILGDLGKAEANFKEALSLRRQINDRAGETATLSGLTRVEQRRGNLAGARIHVENALEIVESLRAKIVNPEQRASFFAQSQDTYKLYIDVLMQLHKREPNGPHATAGLIASERARARSLVETLSVSRAELREGVEESLLARELSLQQRINAKAERLTRILGSAHKEDQAVAARIELANLLAEFQGAQDEIRARSPRYAALTQPELLTLSEIQAMLDPHTLLLEYSLGPERSYVWAITADSVSTYELPARADVETAARRLYETLTARNKSVEGETAEQRLSRTRTNDAKFAEAAERLSDIILRPALRHLKAQRLVIVSEGALQYVPFAALPLPRGQIIESNRLRRSAETPAQPLVLNHEIVSLPSASTLAVLRQEKRKPATKTVAVLADPVFESNDPRFSQNLPLTKKVKPLMDHAIRPELSTDVERSARESGVEKLERLYFSGAEADTIASFTSESQRLKAVGFHAKKANVTSAALSDYRIVHFATHGLINTRHPELSGMVLSLIDERGQPIDGFLRLHEIYNLRLNADLVVLSACQTALGKEIKGEGFIGLSRGFMYAGAPRVVASLWRIDDRATAELVGLFYKAMLEKKLRPAAALQHAQIEMSKKWPSPYHWAGFTLQGEWR